jgi:hypothetical protein
MVAMSVTAFHVVLVLLSTLACAVGDRNALDLFGTLLCCSAIAVNAWLMGARFGYEARR